MEELKTLKRALWKEAENYKFDANSKGIEDAIKFAIRDFSFRTTKKITPGTFGVKEMLEKLEEAEFVSQFKSYFKESPKSKADFDKWHENSCRIFFECVR